MSVYSGSMEIAICFIWNCIVFWSEVLKESSLFAGLMSGFFCFPEIPTLQSPERGYNKRKGTLYQTGRESHEAESKRGNLQLSGGILSC